MEVENSKLPIPDIKIDSETISATKTNLVEVKHNSVNIFKVTYFFKNGQGVKKVQKIRISPRPLKIIETKFYKVTFKPRKHTKKV